MQKAWTIVGQGAVSSLISALAAQRKIPFDVLLRSQVEQAVHALYTDINGCVTSITHTTATHRSQSIHTLLLPLKAYDIKPAFQQYKNLLTHDATIVLMNNGLGVEEQITPFLKAKQTVLLATVTHGALKTSANSVTHTGLGSIFIGKNQRGVNDFQTLVNSLPTASWDNDIRQRLWIKLAINACINPITGINQQTNGSILASQYKITIQNICHEIALVAAQEDLNLAANELIEMVYTVATATQLNYSSMCQDIKHKRKTEIDFINGFIVNKAAQLNMSVPENTRLLKAIKQREARYLT